MWTHPKGGDVVKVVEEEIKLLAQVVLFHWVGLRDVTVVRFVEQ